MTRGAGARGVRWVALLMVLAWLVVGGIGGPLVGRLSEVQTNDNANFLPESAESTAVNQFVLEATDTQSLPYLLVVEKTSGLTDSDRQAVQAYVASIPGLAFAEDPSRTVGEFLLAPPQTVVPSQDNQAVLILTKEDGLPGRIMNWNFNVQRELPWGLLADAAYTGM